MSWDQIKTSFVRSSSTLGSIDREWHATDLSEDNFYVWDIYNAWIVHFYLPTREIQWERVGKFDGLLSDCMSFEKKKNFHQVAKCGRFSLYEL